MQRVLGHIIAAGRWCSITLVLLAAASVGCQESEPLKLPGVDSERALVPPLPPCTDLSEPQKSVKEMLDAINAERAKHNVKPLKPSPKLTKIAEFYACRLVDGQFFSHRDPWDGSTVASRARDYGYAFQKVGENLAAEQTSVAVAMKALLDSEPHKANILDPAFTEVGIAVKAGGDYGIYWVQEFGRPLTEEALWRAFPESAGRPDTTTTSTSQPSAAGS